MNKKQHTIPYFKTQDNNLLIGEKTASELYQKFQHPFVFKKTELINNYILRQKVIKYFIPLQIVIVN